MQVYDTSIIGTTNYFPGCLLGAKRQKTDPIFGGKFYFCCTEQDAQAVGGPEGAREAGVL